MTSVIDDALYIGEYVGRKVRGMRRSIISVSFKLSRQHLLSYSIETPSYDTKGPWIANLVLNLNDCLKMCRQNNCKNDFIAHTFS